MLRLAAVLVPLLMFTACEVDEESPSAEPTAAASASEAPAEAPVEELKMPDLVGMKLDDAYDELADLGLDDKEAVTIEGGGTFGVIIDSNWTVCAQAPAAGEELPEAPTLTVDRRCDEDEGSEPVEKPSESPTAEPTEQASPAPKPKKTTPDKLFDLIDVNGTELGDRFKFVGVLTGEEYWHVGATGEYFVWVSVHRGTNEFEVFIDKDLTAGWGDGTRVEFVVEDSELSIDGEKSDGWMKAVSARKL